MAVKTTPQPAISKGFTLIEILVVIGMFAMVIGGSTTLLMMILRNNQKTETILSIRQEGGSAVSVINRKLTGALEVIGADTICNGSPQATITLKEKSHSENSTVETTIVCIPGTLSIDDQNLISTGPNLSIQNCSLSCYKNNRGTYSFDLELVLKNPNDSSSEDTFTTCAVMRNIK